MWHVHNLPLHRACGGVNSHANLLWKAAACVFIIIINNNWIISYAVLGCSNYTVFKDIF